MSIDEVDIPAWLSVLVIPMDATVPSSFIATLFPSTSRTGEKLTAGRRVLDEVQEGIEEQQAGFLTLQKEQRLVQIADALTCAHPVDQSAGLVAEEETVAGPLDV